MRPKASGCTRFRGDADEGDGSAVGRPYGVAIGVGRRIEKDELVVSGRVDADKAVIAAGARECQQLAVGRPRRRSDGSAGMEHLHRLGCRVGECDGPDLLLGEERDRLAVGGDRRGAAFGELARLSAGSRHEEYGLLHASGQVGGIWCCAASGMLEVTAAHVENGLPIRAPGDVVDFEALVGQVGGNAMRGRGAWSGIRNPDIAFALLISHPQKGRSLRRSLEIGAEGSAHHLLQGEALCGCRRRSKHADTGEEIPGWRTKHDHTLGWKLGTGSVEHLCFLATKLNSIRLPCGRNGLG